MASGSAPTPLVLPPRPASPVQRALDSRSIQIPAITALPAKSTWATVTRNGLRQKATPTAKAVSRPAAKAPNKDTPKAKVNKRLFLRLESDHLWRKLSTCFVRDQVENIMHYMHDSINSFHRVKTGFAMMTKNEKNRQELLDASSKLDNVNAKIEAFPDLIAFRIPNVPVNIVTERGPRSPLRPT